MGKVTVRKATAKRFDVFAYGIGKVTGIEKRWTKGNKVFLALPEDGGVIEADSNDFEVYDLEATETSEFTNVEGLLDIFDNIGFANFKTGEAAPGTLDETPTSGSTNSVKSGGVFNALAGKYGANNPAGYQTSSDVASALSTAAVGILNDRGNHDASGNVFPSTGGSGTSGAVKKGNLWTVSVVGTLGGVAVTIGDVVRALVDTPGQTAGNWVVTGNNIGYVPENSENKSTSESEFASSTKYPVWTAIVAYFSASRIRDILGISTLSGSNTGDQSLGIIERGTFTGAFPLTSAIGGEFTPFTQTGSLPFTIGGSAINGGIDTLLFTANGSPIIGFESWKKLSAESISTVNGTVMLIMVRRYQGVIYYTVNIIS